MSLRIRSKGGTQFGAFDGDGGEGLAIFLTQKNTDVSRYRFNVIAKTSQGPLEVGVFFSSPPTCILPTGSPTRMVAGAVCPGAESWDVYVTCADQNPADETALVVLTSSKCCTSPIGVTRVSERYAYFAGKTPALSTFNVLPGMRILSWSAVASQGVDGSVDLGASPVIIVPSGFSVSGTPGQGLFDTEAFSFTNCEWFIEYLESA